MALTQETLDRQRAEYAEAVRGKRKVNGHTYQARPVPVKRKVGDTLEKTLKNRFSADCTLCFAGTVAELNTRTFDDIRRDRKIYAAMVWENAHVARDKLHKPWARKLLSEHPDRTDALYLELIDSAVDACDCEPRGPAVDATFVWLYLHSEAQGDELLWSMRSVSRFYHGRSSLVLIGDKPEWYKGTHIPMRQCEPCYRHRYRDTLNRLHAACTSDLVPDSFVWMMDDTYFLRHVTHDWLSVNRHNGPIPPRPWGNGEWRDLQRETYDAIKHRHLEVIDWCTHLPKVIEKQKFLAMWDQFDLADRVLAWELLYGALYYRHYKPIDYTFQLIRSSSIKGMQEASVINNGIGGWTDALRRELARLLPDPSPVENESAYNFEIKRGYVSRSKANNNGIAVPDQAQRNVYEYAATLPGVESVIDLGTGSGSKLVRFFEGKQAIGVDVQEKVDVARQRFPNGDWRVAPIDLDADLIICADVLEHLKDPREMLSAIKQGNWKYCVISTPERDIVRGPDSMGPPENPHHVREWNTGEFVRFISLWLDEPCKVQVLGKYNLTVTLRR